MVEAVPRERGDVAPTPARISSAQRRSERGDATTAVSAAIPAQQRRRRSSNVGRIPSKEALVKPWEHMSRNEKRSYLRRALQSAAKEKSIRAKWDKAGGPVGDFLCRCAGAKIQFGQHDWNAMLDWLDMDSSDIKTTNNSQQAKKTSPSLVTKSGKKSLKSLL
jgi:hypothetical protein